MKNNKGITLISLISSVILLIILASITIVTSTNSYNQMKFEGAKAELEEMQKLVDEIATDYQTYLREQGGTKTYQEYFKDRYGATDFSDKLLSSHQTEASQLLQKNPSLNEEKNEMIFFFTKDDINKYFDLKGINDVVVDFSTRTVYSVSGIKDPDDKTKIYYTSSDWGDDRKVSPNSKENNSVTVTAKQEKKDVSNFDVKITITGKINNVSEVYGGIDDKYSKIDNFRVITFTESKTDTEPQTEIMVSVTGAGNYKFKVIDELNNSYVTSQAIELK